MELIRRIEEEARAALPAEVYDFYAGGAGDEQTLAENVDAWRRVWLRPRGLVDVSATSAACSLLGADLAAPLVVAPMATQRRLHPEGEVATCRGAAAAGVGFCLSTRSSAAPEEVARAGRGLGWFQLYVDDDRAVTEELLGRVAGAGFSHVVVTIDLAVLGRRERERRGGLAPGGGWSRALVWTDLDWVRAASGLPVLVKGVVTGEDAALAVEHGAVGVVVSNHGARQLDGCVPTAVALREVAAEVAGRVPVLVDGGVRSGVDVVRALALGASAVLVGRPVAWALATGGGEGVRAVLEALVADVELSLALLGVSGPGEVGPGHARLAGW